jgi:hypothetical protein
MRDDPFYRYLAHQDRHCERSEAKQSISPRKERVDCFVVEFIIGPAKGRTRWLLAMTADSATLKP